MTELQFRTYLELWKRGYYSDNDSDIFNPLLSNLYTSKNRFIINYGGAGSGKSFSQTQHEILKCLSGNEKLLVIRKVNNTLKDSVISLFISILNSWGLSDYYKVNKADQYINFKNGSQILFKGMDDPEKIKSIAGITRIWIEEASELSKEDFQQLNLRLRGRDNLQITLTFNPIDEEHWIKKYFFDNPSLKERCTIIKTTYKNNKFIDQAYKDELESYQHIDQNYYKIYALGEWGGITEGRIFPIWEQIDSFPEIDGYWFGLDFGYSCFSGDTLVTTEHGQKKICDIKQGDEVLTREGFKKVKKVFNNGIKKVHKKRLYLDNKIAEISATYEHNFNANGKWKKYGRLTTKDKLFVLLSLMGNNLKDTHGVNTQITTILNTKKKESTFAKSFMLKFGKSLTDKYPMVLLSIIKILIRLITRLIILLQSRHQNTPKYTEFSKHSINTSEQNTLKNTDIVRKTGKKDALNLLKQFKKNKKNVFGVVQNILQQMYIKGFVLKNVIINGSIKILKMILNLFVSGVELILQEINISNQNHAQTVAHIKSAEIKEIEQLESYYCPVYDLWIEDCHEYFANGILVHNCDPAAIVKTIKWRDRIYLDEVCYQKGLTNKDIANVFKDHGYHYEPVICDSAEPKSIEELRQYGINAIAASKGHGSILAGIDYLKSNKILVTKSSLNIIKENRYYQWKQDKSGKFINQPKDFLNHIIDATRYAHSLCDFSQKSNSVLEVDYSDL